jgi:hypothetical protein
VSKLTSRFALWIVVAAVLFVLLSPLTPGAVAPHGGKLLKPDITFALNTWIAVLLLASLSSQLPTCLRKIDTDPVSLTRLISLRC